MKSASFYSDWRPHPWHGLEPGMDPPKLVNAYIEVTPFDMVKYEIDKFTGYLRVDRPLRNTSQPPTLYGFIPRTYCDKRVADLSSGADNGDLDPLDICVVSERPINRSEVIVNAKVVGGLNITDQGKADDKIIAVLSNDNIYGSADNISELPKILIERLIHYFHTYKIIPGKENAVTIGKIYPSDHALKVVAAALQDYEENFGSH